VSLDDKVEKYFYYLINYGHETASVWAQGNVELDEIEEFKIKLNKSFGRHGFERR
jgi:hypothetical protein